jgi:excinuclease ABC subunit C
MTPEEFASIAPSIPLQPGVYRYYNAENELLYVGKAKQLRKRISSYFNKQLQHYKTVELVRRIHHIEFTIVNNEQDAFLLENSLIKKYQPLFNINLKDDKTYPYIVVRNEPFPRIYFTRNKRNDGSRYFGPFASVQKVRELLQFIRQMIPLRTCTLPLTPANIQKGKFKVCLEYHLGNCKGPCEAHQTEAEYQSGIQRIEDILKGNLAPVMQELKSSLKAAVDELAFEKAAVWQQKIKNLEQYQSRSAVVNTRTGTIDVFALMEDDEKAYVHYLGVNNGSIIHTQTIELQKNLAESKEDLLVFSIAHFRQTYQSAALEIITPFPIDYPQTDISVTVPKAGDKKMLLELCSKNAEYFVQMQRSKKALLLDESDPGINLAETLESLQEALQLAEIPDHIECFDNSNFHGTNAVAAMVCFKQGLPSKKDYRHFNIKTVVGSNDFASMEEIVFRRYNRLLSEQEPIPSLIIIDGGKGQLNAAMNSIRKLGLEGKVTVVGLAKNLEELFFPGDSESIRLPWKSEGLNLIRRIRDEVHRFGITHHRNKRSKSALTNELEEIPGIGKATAAELLKTFKSVKRIKEQSEEALSAIIGPSKGKLVYGYFQK